MISKFTRNHLVIFALVMLFTNSAYSQISGTKTIGGVSPDYATFTDAFAVLNLSGVSGPVVFNVRPGTYSEQLQLNVVAGSSSMNNIIFQAENGDSTSVVLDFASAVASTNNYALKLNGCDFVTFRKLSFERSGTAAYSRIIEFTNGSDNITFQNCVFTGVVATTSTTNNCIIYSAAGLTSIDNNFSFQNNVVRNGSYGVYAYGGSTTQHESFMIINNNTFLNQYGRAINLGNTQNANISGNIISTNATNATYYGIYLTYASSGLQIRKNKITGQLGGYGIYMTTCIGDASSEGIISNNFIQVGAAANAAYGMYLTACQLQGIYYNNVSINSSNAGTGRGLTIIGTTSQKMDVRNNILANLGGGYAYYVSAPLAITTSNYNNLFTTGTNLGYWSTADVLTLAAWRTASGYDNASKNVNPGYTSLTDLHVSAPSLNNTGQTITGITTDIDGETRHLTTPDIGADEFTPLTDNIGMLAVIDPQSGNCGSMNTLIRVALKNFGTNAQTNIPVTVDVTGAATASYTATYTGNLLTSAIDTLIISANLNTSMGGMFDIVAYASMANDQFRDNDTIRYNFSSQALPVEPTANISATVCAGPVTVSVTPADPSDIVYWYNAPVGGNQINIGNSYSTTANMNTNYYAEARSGGSMGVCLRITEVEVGTNDFIEIQNMSTSPINAAGWIVATSNSYTDINLVNVNTWNLGNFNAGEIQYKTDLATDNYWGSNLLYSPGSPGWVVIMDNLGGVVDFLAWQWTDAQIQAMNTTIAGFNFTPGSQWSGNGAVSCANASSISRQGNSDNNTIADFICQAPTKNVINPGLTYPFNFCGVGLCPSIRVTVPVSVFPVSVVSLGNDTVISVGSSITLDAGAGFVSYLWNDNSTSQTLTTNAAGTYYVTVIDNNGCSASDTIVVNLNIGINELGGKATMSLYPNPATSKTVVELSSKNVAFSTLELINITGQIVYRKELSAGENSITLDLSSFEAGIYFVNVRSIEGSMRQKLIVK